MPKKGKRPHGTLTFLEPLEVIGGGEGESTTPTT